jgi:hypothetical protein
VAAIGHTPIYPAACLAAVVLLLQPPGRRDISKLRRSSAPDYQWWHVLETTTIIWFHCNLVGYSFPTFMQDARCNAVAVLS